MVEESGELIRCPLLCCLSYAAQRLGHTFPVLSPAGVALIRIPLGPRPSLHWLRRWLPSFVRRLRRCRVGGGALSCPRADLRPPLKLDVQFSRIQLSWMSLRSLERRDQRD